MPWCGSDNPAEFPTIGYAVADWIETYCIIPDREAKGAPYLLTDEMLMHLLWTYRVHPTARVDDGSMAFTYYGTQLIRPQKWGKDPFGAMQVIAQALGEVRFDGWDADGQPVAAPMPTPWIQCAGNAEEQTDNTYLPILTCLREGPLQHTAGLDVGDTRVKLPGGGLIEPVTASSRARQGARITYVTLTESHLMTEASRGLALARTLKRNVAGMDGRWLEITNAWDPTERSAAQKQFESSAPGVYKDYRPPRVKVQLDDDMELYTELVYVYGDSAKDNGGWSNIKRRMAEIRDDAMGENEARRYFLNEITVGSKDAVNALLWNMQARPDDLLLPKTRITLGFAGSTNRKSTSLCASRMSDGRLFHLQTWERPPHVAEANWSVPREEVHTAMKAAWAAYEVLGMFGTPAGWQTEMNTWAGEHGVKDPIRFKTTHWHPQVLELWLNSEMRMDQLVERFRTAHRGDELTHDGSETLTQHAFNSALADGKKKASAEDKQPGESDFYQRVVSKGGGLNNSAFMAALLAYETRGWAIERGALTTDNGPSLW